MVSVADMMRASTDSLLRYAAWVGAHVPRFREGDSTAHWKYKLACAIARAIKRGGGSAERDPVHERPASAKSHGNLIPLNQEETPDGHEDQSH